jgi:predicted HAD superfamily Cof-like phosphohydrolase
MLKETADVQYVLSGMSAKFAWPIAEVYARVHESNMSKLGDDGRPVRRADGKILKGPNYHPPRLDDLIP